MPFLDVSEALTDSMFTSLITVLRRVEQRDGHGRVQMVTTTWDDVVAIVTAGEGKNLVREPDQEHAPNSIVVHTKFRLRGPSPGFQPDVVMSNGDQYVVRRLRDWSQFGAGYVAADCESMSLIDAPTPRHHEE